MRRMHRDATYDSARVNDRRFGRLVNLQGEIWNVLKVCCPRIAKIIQWKDCSKGAFLPMSIEQLCTYAWQHLPALLYLDDETSILDASELVEDMHTG
jgi:hypothetical protein